MLADLLPWVALLGPLAFLLIALEGPPWLAELLTWAVALGLGAFLVYATGSVAVVPVWVVGVWWLGGLLRMFSSDR